MHASAESTTRPPGSSSFFKKRLYISRLEWDEWMNSLDSPRMKAPGGSCVGIFSLIPRTQGSRVGEHSLGFSRGLQGWSESSLSSTFCDPLRPSHVPTSKADRHHLGAQAPSCRVGALRAHCCGGGPAVQGLRLLAQPPQPSPRLKGGSSRPLQTPPHPHPAPVTPPCPLSRRQLFPK